LLAAAACLVLLLLLLLCRLLDTPLAAWGEAVSACMPQSEKPTFSYPLASNTHSRWMPQSLKGL